MAATMNSNMQQSIAHTNPPVLGGTEARALVDELMGFVCCWVMVC
jgi:hypothetical protein